MRLDEPLEAAEKERCPGRDRRAAGRSRGTADMGAGGEPGGEERVPDRGSQERARRQSDVEARRFGPGVRRQGGAVRLAGPCLPGRDSAGQKEGRTIAGKAQQRGRIRRIKKRQASRKGYLPSKLVGPPGFEPGTCRL